MSIPLPAPPYARPEEQRLRISAIPWEGYVQIGRALTDRHIRVTFDRGELESRTTSSTHELDRHLLDRTVDTPTEEKAIDVAVADSFAL